MSSRAEEDEKEKEKENSCENISVESKQNIREFLEDVDN